MPPRAGERGAAGPPALLQRIYGAGAVVSLQDLLLSLCRASSEAGGLGARLAAVGDPPAYTALLRRTWCVLRPGAPPLRGGFTLQQASTQEQVCRHGCSRAVLGIRTARVSDPRAWG